jgi:hypothetical protein
MSARGPRRAGISLSVVNNLERLRGPRDEDLSAVIVRLFGEQANEQIAELLSGEQGPRKRGRK